MTVPDVMPDSSPQVTGKLTFVQTLGAIVVMALAIDWSAKLIGSALGLISMLFAMSAIGLSFAEALDILKGSIVNMFGEGSLDTLPPVLIHSTIVVSAALSHQTTDSLRKNLWLIVISSTLVYAITMGATDIISNISRQPSHEFWLGILVLYLVYVGAALLGGWALAHYVRWLRRRERDRLNRAKGWY